MQYVVVDSATGLPVVRADGQVLALDLPEGAYAVEWLEHPIAYPVTGNQPATATSVVALGNLLEHSAAPPIERSLFDEVIDCLYEYDLGQELSDKWPQPVRDAIEAARLRILASR